MAERLVKRPTDGYNYRMLLNVLVIAVQLQIPVRPEYSCSPREIVMMESLNDWKFANLVQFGYPYPTTVRRILV